MRRFVAPILLSLFLAACGGGGGDASSTASAGPTSAPPASSPPTSSPPPAPSPATASTCTLAPADVQSSFVQLVNNARASNRNCGTTTYGATAGLAWNAKLATAATSHSEDMAAKNYFDHTGSDGSSPATRVTQAGYTWTMVGENIAWRSPASASTTDQTMQDWLNSPGHCANIMNPQFTEIGVACAEGSAANGNPNQRYWTMVLARP